MDQLPIAIRLLLAGLIDGPVSVFVGATGGRNISFAASSPAGELAAPSHKTMSQTTWYQIRGPATVNRLLPRQKRHRAAKSPICDCHGAICPQMAGDYWTLSSHQAASTGSKTGLGANRRPAFLRLWAREAMNASQSTFWRPRIRALLKSQVVQMGKRPFNQVRASVPQAHRPAGGTLAGGAGGQDQGFEHYRHRKRARPVAENSPRVRKSERAAAQPIAAHRRHQPARIMRSCRLKFLLDSWTDKVAELRHPN